MDGEKTLSTVLWERQEAPMHKVWRPGAQTVVCAAHHAETQGQATHAQMLQLLSTPSYAETH